MTDLKDLELRIKSAESTLEMLRGELEELRQQEQQEPESLFGRWATHPEYGRGIIASSRTDDRNRALFGNIGDPTALVAQWRYVPIGDLTLDPLTLNTADDFEEAPVGTIVEVTEYPHDVIVKNEVAWYKAGDKRAIAFEYEPTCRVIRWGNGQ
jgi:hypothetical protein